MSVFSDLLSEYITMKDVGVYPLSQFCGLDRSFMYKIINGKRNPSGEDVVRKMAQFMQLTPREKTDFMDAFYITQMGEEVYYRRKSVGELMEDGIRSKIAMMDDECQMKLQDTMQKIVNDNNGGMVCIII